MTSEAVVVAGSDRTVGRIVSQLASRGRSAIPAIVLATEPPEDRRALDAALARLAAGGYDAIAVTSAAAAEALAGVRLPDTTWVAAVGPGTADALVQRGIEVRLTPHEASAARLVQDWPRATGRRVLLPRSDLARPELEDGLRRLGERPEAVVAYRTVRREPPPEVRRALRGGAAIVVTSPSAFDAVREVLPAEPVVVAIGGTTADAVREAGMRVAATASTPDAVGVVAALVAAGR